MDSHKVTVELTVSVTNPTMVSAIGGSGNERTQIETAVNRGIQELQPIAARYGFEISDSRATVA